MVEPSRPNMPIMANPNEVYNFVCTCGASFHPSSIQDHYFKCEKLKSEYGELLLKVGDYQERAVTLQQQKNFVALLEFF